MSTKNKTTTKVVTIIVAAGSGKRFDSTIPKQYISINGRTLIDIITEKFLLNKKVDEVIVVVNPDHSAFYKKNSKVLSYINGGNTRQVSVCNALNWLNDRFNIDKVLIHDAARVFVEDQTINNVINALDDHDAVVPVLAISDTIKKIQNNVVISTIDRESLYAAHTPQGFKFPLICKLHNKYQGAATNFTDDASLVEHHGLSVFTVPSSAINFKITTQADLGERSFDTSS